MVFHVGTLGGDGAIPARHRWLPKAQAISIRLVSAREVCGSFVHLVTCASHIHCWNSGVTGVGSEKKLGLTVRKCDLQEPDALQLTWMRLD